MTDLTPKESLILQWLAAGGGGQYGECEGLTLDSLLAKNLVMVEGPESGRNNTFIAKGPDIAFRVVRLTDAGRAAIEDVKQVD